MTWETGITKIFYSGRKWSRKRIIFQRTFLEGVGIPAQVCWVPRPTYHPSWISKESFQMFPDMSVKGLWKKADGDVSCGGFVMAGRESCKNTFFLLDCLGFFLKPDVRFLFACFSWVTQLWAYLMNLTFELKLVVQPTKRLTVYSAWTHVHCCVTHCESRGGEKRFKDRGRLPMRGPRRRRTQWPVRASTVCHPKTCLGGYYFKLVIF